MKKNLFFFVILSITFSAFAQNEKQFSRLVFSKDISFVRSDTVHGSQTTVLEYPKFLVVIELPMIDEGGGKATNLEQDIPKAERFLSFLQKQYNNKPVKYVLSSHWHLHSTSGISPFLRHGATLVITTKNWEYCVKNGLFGNTDTKTLEKQVMFVDKDTHILENTENPISALYLDETYTNKPTKDYLFFYMPKIKCLHASCMCAINEIDFKQRPEFVYNDRVTDLEKVIKTRNLEIENLFKLTQEYDAVTKTYKVPAFKSSYYQEFKQRGKPVSEIVKSLSKYELSFLQANKDSVLHELIAKKIPATIVNATVYSFIKNEEYAKALQWAQILNLYQPGEINFLDSMGEAYFNAGDIVMANHISSRLAILNKKMPNQIKAWEQAKLDH
jgi:hypothetical protein